MPLKWYGILVVNFFVPFSGSFQSLNWGETGPGGRDTVTAQKPHGRTAFLLFPPLASFQNSAEINHNNEEKLLTFIWISVLDRPVLFHVA